jgi:ABC-type Mn2+/Zn2+ transport system permease subunit
MGLWLSWLWNLPSGASIVLFAAVLFFLAYFLGAVRRFTDRDRPAEP